jgi:phage I-like protein
VSQWGPQRAQLKLGELSAVRATAYFDFALGNDGKREAPAEFRVFPAGSFTTTKGTFVFTPRSAASVMAWYEKRQLPLMGDYEHQTDEPAVGRPPMIARASITEMTPVIRMNAAGGPELWVENVKWTKAARKMLEAGEYRFFSPTFLHDPETKEVLAILRIALTNDPAIDDLEPLVAATAGTTEEETPMGTEAATCAKCAATDAHLNTLKDQLSTLDTAHKALIGKHQELGTAHQTLVGQHQELSAAHGAMLKSFEDWAAEEADEPEHQEATAATATTTAKASLCAKRIADLRAFRKDFVTLTGEKKSGAMLGKATAWKTGAGELVTLKAEQDKLAKVTLAANFKTLTDKAVSDGKLPPAERDHYVKLTETKGVEYVMEFLSARLGATTAPVVNTTVTTPPSQEAAMALATLSAGEQAQLAKLFPSLSIEDAAKGKSTWQKSLPTVLAARADK